MTVAKRSTRTPTNRILQLLSMAATCLLFTSCADSKFPLSDPGKSEPDERLTGVWRKRGESGEVSFAPAGGKSPASVFRVAVSRRKPDGTTEQLDPMLLFPTTIGGKTYLNVTVGKDEKMKLLEEKGWTPETIPPIFFLRYQVTEDTLTVQGIDGEAKKRAIQAGKVKGESFDGGFVFMFTDTTENLAKFVAEAGDDLFSKDVLKLQRVK